MFVIWHSCQPTLGQFVLFGQILIVVNGHILKKQFGHLVTLITAQLLSLILLQPKKYLLTKWPNRNHIFNKKLTFFGGAAQWNSLRLPSCCPGFESQANHLSFISFIVKFVLYLSLFCEKNENKQKEAGFGPFFKVKLFHFPFHSIRVFKNGLSLKAYSD